MGFCDAVERKMPDIFDIVGIVLWLFVYTGVALWIYGDIADTYGISALKSCFGIGLGFLVLTTGFKDSMQSFFNGMDPLEILSHCYSDKDMPEEERLIKAHELAVSRAYSLFVKFLAYWILIGVANSVLLLYGIPHWLTTVSIGVFSIASFLSFILWIISYLRYRDYSKKLFLLQLNKGKAEVSIKI